MKKAIDIKIGEKNYHFPLTIGFVGQCLENLELDVFELGEKLDKNVFKFVPSLMYESLKYDAYINDKELDLTFKRFLVTIDDDDDNLNIINTFLKSFVVSLRKNVPKQDETNDVKPKKKVTQKK